MAEENNKLKSKLKYKAEQKEKWGSLGNLLKGAAQMFYGINNEKEWNAWVNNQNQNVNLNNIIVTFSNKPSNKQVKYHIVKSGEYKGQKFKMSEIKRYMEVFGLSQINKIKWNNFFHWSNQ